MRSLIILILIYCLFENCYGQNFSLPYLLSEKPNFSELIKDCDLTSNEEIRLLDERAIEFAYDDKNTLFEYFYIHIVQYVNSEEAIDRNNKIYVSLNGTKELVAYDCRVVSSKNEIKLLGKDALKEGTNENEQKVQYFAVSGAEKGSIIEYFYLIKRSANIMGNYLIFQRDIPVAKSIFKIISPINLIFTSKSYNGYSELISDSTLKDKNYLKAQTLNIPKIKKEDFANEDANKMIVVYKLFFNTNIGKKNPFNNGMASQNIFENISEKPSNKAVKEIEKILKSSNMAFARDEENKIFRIEDYVKSNFNFIESSNDQLSNLEVIFKLKSFNSLGAIKLFYQLYELAGIDNEIVTTINRYNIKFDAEFDSWAFLDKYLLYFPSIKKYLMPSALDYRLGIVPFGYIANKGLFIKKTKVGDIYTGVGKVKNIPENTPEQTQHQLYVSAKINQTFDSLYVSSKQVYSGYYAQSYQPVFDYISADKLKEFEEDIVKSLFKDAKIKSLQIENKGCENLMINPLVVKCDFSSSSFLDKANDKILFKIGDLIGPQSELYQNNDRVLPIENDFNRIYLREITFIVPDGYKIKNPENLKIEVQPFIKDGDGAGFISSYTLDENKLLVKISEYYKQLMFPKSDYEKYRSVINAAANFNKIALVLEKKN